MTLPADVSRFDRVSDWVGSLILLREEPRHLRDDYVITISGTELHTTAVFDTYWRFAVERQEMFFRRLRGQRPLTEDQILAAHRFTNAYRASDRVSQFLIREVIGKSGDDNRDLFFRILLFKLFNRIGTWIRLESELGAAPSLSNYDFQRYSEILGKMLRDGERIYSGAYIMPAPRLGAARKHANHLLLLERMLNDDVSATLAESRSMEEAYHTLLRYPSLGPFLAFQFTIDLNYSSLLDFDEGDFVVAGPGAVDGIRKCFTGLNGLSYAAIIGGMAEMAGREFGRLGLSFTPLFGRALQLIDCQNLFCEVGKYARYFHPEAVGVSGRTRIKQRYRPNPTPLRLAYPAKWNLEDPVAGVRMPLSI